MSTIGRILLASAIGAALAFSSPGCGERSDTATPPKPAEHAPAPPRAQPPAPPPAPPIPAEIPDAPSNPNGAAKADAANGAAKADAANGAAKADVEAGRADYKIYCASCHGETGAGDGPVAQALDPKPAHHNDGSYMNPLTDEYLFKVIKFGGASVGKSSMMAPLGGSLSDQQIRNVIAYIRTLADPPYHP